jgi:hypothetical protein
VPNLNPSNFTSVWTAAVTHAQETNRPLPRCLLILYADGAIAEVKSDGRALEGWGDSPGEFPALAGWSFRAGMVAFNGRVFRLGGLRYRLLRALVDGRGAPVRDQVLKVRIWADGMTEDERLKDVAYGLRAVLRAELELGTDVDPVERVEGGYRLAVISAW